MAVPDQGVLNGIRQLLHDLRIGIGHLNRKNADIRQNLCLDVPSCILHGDPVRELRFDHLRNCRNRKDQIIPGVIIVIILRIARFILPEGQVVLRGLPVLSLPGEPQPDSGIDKNRCKNANHHACRNPPKLFPKPQPETAPVYRLLHVIQHKHLLMILPASYNPSPDRPAFLASSPAACTSCMAVTCPSATPSVASGVKTIFRVSSISFRSSPRE